MTLREVKKYINHYCYYKVIDDGTMEDTWHMQGIAKINSVGDDMIYKVDVTPSSSQPPRLQLLPKEVIGIINPDNKLIQLVMK